MLKSFPTQLAALTGPRTNKRNLRILLRFLIVLALMITVYSITFHLLMLREGQQHSWLTGFYWTLTVMSTLGFGDITFGTDTGRVFSMIVLVSGMVFLLVLLPFTFIEFFYEPWMRSQMERRMPRGVDDDVSGHVILTHWDAVTTTLARRLDTMQTPHVLLTPDAEEAQALQDRGVKLAVGQVDDPETWRRAGVERAALVLATGSDIANSTAAFTVREVSASVPIVATAQNESSIDVLQLAGANHVMRFEQMMGQALARRVLGGVTTANVIGRVEGVLIAEASAHGTPLVGKTLRDSGLRENVGLAVAGVWQRGKFEPGRADTAIEDNTVLVVVGSEQQIQAYDAQFGKYGEDNAPVLILGGGRVGRATAAALRQVGLDYRIVEKDPQFVPVGSERHLLGDAAEFDVLDRAGIGTTQSIVITTHHDDVNVFLTIYCRKLRPDAQILARATLERNVATLHRAGADFVLSYASMASNAVLNLMHRGQMLLLAEGLDVLRVRVPRALVDKTIGDCEIREKTECSVVALRIGGEMRIVPAPGETLRAGADMLLVGTVAAQEAFLREYPDALEEHDEA